MEVICHIGMPKTGSTTVQEFLRLNASALAMQDVHYRRFRSDEPVQPDYLFVAFRGARRIFEDAFNRIIFKVSSIEELDQRVAAFEKWLEGQNLKDASGTWVVSCEPLTAYLRGRPGVQALHDWFAARFSRVTYLIYLRRQDHWAASDYSESLRFGSGDTLEVHLARPAGCNYLPIVRTWGAVAGPESLKVRLLEPDALAGGDLVTDFCEAVGINPSGLQRPEPLNQGFSRRGAVFVRLINAGVARFMPRHSVASRAIRKIARQIAVTILAGGDRVRLGAAQSAEFMAQFAASNEALRAQYFPEREWLFAPAATPLPDGPFDIVRRDLDPRGHQ